jgi:hypothetical protein
MPSSKPQEPKKVSLMDADPTFIQAYVKPAFELEFLTSVRKKGILHVKFTILRTVAALGRCSLALVAIVTVLF